MLSVISLGWVTHALFFRCQDLLKLLKDAKTELQLTKDEVEQVNKDVNKW